MDGLARIATHTWIKLKADKSPPKRKGASENRRQWAELIMIILIPINSRVHLEGGGGR